MVIRGSSGAPERAGRHHRYASCSHDTPAFCLGVVLGVVMSAVLSASPAASPLMSAVHAASGSGAPWRACLIWEVGAVESGRSQLSSAAELTHLRGEIGASARAVVGTCMHTAGPCAGRRAPWWACCAVRYHWSSRVINALVGVPLVDGPIEAQSMAINGNQWQSMAINGHQRTGKQAAR